jgi:cytochrome bd-type quinol oxidase subunit 1
LFTGPTTQIPPQPTPMKARPTTIIAAFFAAISKIQPITKGTKMSKSVRRRPMKFMTMPTKMQTDAAPMLRIELQRFHSVGDKMKLSNQMMIHYLTAVIYLESILGSVDNFVLQIRRPT